MNRLESKPFKVVLLTKGRKSARIHSVWLRAVMYQDKLYFSRHFPDSDWFKNALSNPAVEIGYEGQKFSGNASLVNDESLAKKISQLKYPGKKRAQESRVVLEVILNGVNLL